MNSAGAVVVAVERPEKGVAMMGKYRVYRLDGAGRSGDVDIGQVAGVRAVGVVQPVLPAGRVPVCTGACEAGRIAAADRVDVDAVEAVRKPRSGDPEADSARGLPGADAADGLPGGVDQ